MRLYVFVALVLLLPATCLAGARYIYTNHRLDYVKIDSIGKKELAEKAPTQPATLSVEKVRDVLASIKLNRKLMFKKEVATQDVFNEKAVNFLAPRLVEAFQQATAEEEVIFSYLLKDPDFVFRDDKFTVAKAWMKDNEMHVEFLKLYAKLEGDYDKRGNFNKVVNRAKGIRIELEAGPGQMLGASNPHELVIDMNHVAVAQTTPAAQPATVTKKGKGSVVSPAAQYPPAPPPGTSSPTQSSTGSPGSVALVPQADMQQRLRELSKLRRAKLITDEEYQAKRSEILQNL